jgi:hypothetical protein
VKTLWEQARDSPQLLDRSFIGEDAGSSKSPAHNIGLGNSGFDLAGTNHPKICHRALGRLCHRNQSRDAATAALHAGKRVSGLRNGACKHPADLEEAASSRSSADAEETRFLPARWCRSPQQENNNDSS